MYDAIIVHSSRTLKFSLLLQSTDTVKMGTFLANSLSTTVEESLQQTLIARSGSPHNVLHSLVVMRAFLGVAEQVNSWGGEANMQYTLSGGTLPQENFEFAHSEIESGAIWSHLEASETKHTRREVK